MPGSTGTSPPSTQYSINLDALFPKQSEPPRRRLPSGAQVDTSTLIPSSPPIEAVRSEDVGGPDDFTLNIGYWMRVNLDDMEQNMTPASLVRPQSSGSIEIQSWMRRGDEKLKTMQRSWSEQAQSAAAQDPPVTAFAETEPLIEVAGNNTLQSEPPSSHAIIEDDSNSVTSSTLEEHERELSYLSDDENEEHEIEAIESIVRPSSALSNLDSTSTSLRSLQLEHALDGTDPISTNPPKPRDAENGRASSLLHQAQQESREAQQGSSEIANGVGQPDAVSELKKDAEFEHQTSGTKSSVLDALQAQVMANEHQIAELRALLASREESWASRLQGSDAYHVSKQEQLQQRFDRQLKEMQTSFGQGGRDVRQETPVQTCEQQPEVSEPQSQEPNPGEPVVNLVQPSPLSGIAAFELARSTPGDGASRSTPTSALSSPHHAAQLAIEEKLKVIPRVYDHEPVVSREGEVTQEFQAEVEASTETNEEWKGLYEQQRLKLESLAKQNEILRQEFVQKTALLEEEVHALRSKVGMGDADRRMLPSEGPVASKNIDRAEDVVPRGVTFLPMQDTPEDELVRRRESRDSTNEPKDNQTDRVEELELLLCGEQEKVATLEQELALIREESRDLKAQLQKRPVRGVAPRNDLQEVRARHLSAMTAKSDLLPLSRAILAQCELNEVNAQMRAVLGGREEGKGDEDSDGEVDVGDDAKQEEHVHGQRQATGSGVASEAVLRAALAAQLVATEDARAENANLLRKLEDVRRQSGQAARETDSFIAGKVNERVRSMEAKLKASFAEREAAWKERAESLEWERGRMAKALMRSWGENQVGETRPQRYVYQCT